MSKPSGMVNRTSGRLAGDVFHEAERTISVDRESDVIVCGGGPAGFAAALSAARHGARTTLLEVHGCLGGVWTAGLLGLILDADNKTGIMAELLDELKARGGRSSPGGRKTYHVEVMKWTLEDLCVRAGIRLRYFTRVAGVAVEDGRVQAAITESKAGREAWAAKVFIDCTGDGDLGAQAGCGFDVGRDASCLCQPMSLIGLLTGIDPDEVDDYALIGKSLEGKDRLRELLKTHGAEPSYFKPSLFHLHRDLFALMANHEYGVSAFDPGQITQATINARAELQRIVAALKKAGGPWTGVNLVATAEQIGVREGRRIHGRYMVTADDLIEGRSHADSVCKATFPVDVHTLTKDSGKSQGYSAEGVKSQPYDIPIGALIARDVDGLMMAGRCISGEFLAHASYRVTGNAVAMGEAAGGVAAMAAASDRLPQQVGMEEVRSTGE